MDPTPEELLGKEVLAPTGEPVGTVVDVGLVTWRQPKFLLVRSQDPARLMRIDIRQVEDVAAPSIRLLIPPSTLVHAV
jgi:sporulation protein YlmC with PRC-barrel domain